MSGSSLDGLDIACVEVNSASNPVCKILEANSYSLPDKLVAELSILTQKTALQIAEIESEYSQFVAYSINQFCNDYDIDCRYCSIHGHTVLHLPEIKTSWQLLNGGMVAQLTQKTIISDFRNQDLMEGGQGTPMVSILDRDVFGKYDACINLGGIANITLLNSDDVVSYDLCPCNQVHNYYAQKLGYEFDSAGQLGRQGQLVDALLDVLLSDSYMKQAPPKSIDNSWIKEHWIELIDTFQISVYDKLFTHYFFVSWILAQAVENCQAVLITGGGAKNKFLIDLLRNRLDTSTQLIVPDSIILDYKEAMLMAYMAYLRLEEKMNFIPQATGANKAVSSGAVYIYKQ